MLCCRLETTASATLLIEPEINFVPGIANPPDLSLLTNLVGNNTGYNINSLRLSIIGRERSMTRIATSHQRYKRPPRKRKAVASRGAGDRASGENPRNGLGCISAMEARPAVVRSALAFLACIANEPVASPDVLP